MPRFSLLWVLLAVVAASSVSMNIALCLRWPSRDRIEPMFSPLDGESYEGKYVDLGPNDELHMRYSPTSDSGVEIERVRNGQTVWVAFVEPLYIAHSEYEHRVQFISFDEEWKTSGEIQIRSTSSSGTIVEHRRLDDGELIKREVERYDGYWASRLR